MFVQVLCALGYSELAVSSTSESDFVHPENNFISSAQHDSEAEGATITVSQKKKTKLCQCKIDRSTAKEDKNEIHQFLVLGVSYELGDF